MLALGHSEDNEKLFNSIKAFQKPSIGLLNKTKVYCCSIGQTVTSANYYLRDQKCVETLIHDIAKYTGNLKSDFNKLDIQLD